MSLPLLHAGRTNPGLSAALDLRFALDKSLTAYRGPTPSFSRASTGSYFDGSGVLRYANVNTILYSEEFGNAYWFKSGLSISADSTVAPDGKTTADKVVENASSGIKYGTIAGGFSVVSGTTYTFSAYAKDSGRYFGFATNSTAFPNAIGAVFNLTNGTISNIQANTTASIQSVGNGWYRCIITGTANASTTTNINFGISNDLNQIYPSYTGNGSSGYFLWGFQMETGSTVGTYCPTTTSANSAPRFNHTYNGTSWVSRGLLVEEQRTNLLQRSEEFNTSPWTALNASVSANAIASPDGNTTADKVVESATGPHGHEVYYLFSASATTYTTTVFSKAGERSSLYISLGSTINNGVYFNLLNGTVGTATGGLTGQIQDVGNGWYRCSVTGALSAGTNYIQIALSNGTTYDYIGNGTSGIYLFGAQLEVGSFATSYIPTTTASTTRSADVCQITGSDFSGFWNGTEGTIVGDFDRLFIPTGTASALYTARDSSNNNAIYYYIDVSKDVSQVYASGASATFDFGSPVGAGISNKIATAYKANDFAASRNGSTPLTDTSGAVPSGQTLMEIGSTVSANYLNGHIARLRYYRKRLPNATLQLLSEPDPTLNLQFALNKTLTPVAGPAPSFSRASTGTYFNASGVLTSASINTPRFDHIFSGGQWVSRGLLLEEQRTNILQYSEDISYGGWTKTDASVSVNSGIAPDGNMTADKLVENTASGVAHRMYYPLSMGTSSSFSAFFKAAGRNYVMMMIYAGANAKLAYFDILNGSVVSTNTPQITAKVDPVGNGWFRCSVTYSGVDPSSFVQVHMSPNGITDTYNGDGTSGMFIWGLQAENNVSFPTSYISTTSSSTTRSADVCQITGTSFNWMWNQGEGSVVAEYDRLAVKSSEQQVFNASTSSGGQQVSYNLHPSNDYAMFWTGSIQAQLNTGSAIQPGVVGKNASSYKINDFAMSFNGGAIVSDTAGVVPIPDRLGLGSDLALGSFYLNGHIAKLIYYPARLTNTKLQQLST